jgi:hypothetical protein
MFRSHQQEVKFLVAYLVQCFVNASGNGDGRIACLNVGFFASNTQRSVAQVRVGPRRSFWLSCLLSLGSSVFTFLSDPLIFICELLKLFVGEVFNVDHLILRLIDRLDYFV